MAHISVTVDVGPGMISDILEESYQLALKLHVGVKFKGNGTRWEVFPYTYAISQNMKTGEIDTWNRDMKRNRPVWSKLETSENTKQLLLKLKESLEQPL